MKGLVAQSCPTQLLATSGTIACQVPLSTGFSRQEHWSRLPFPSPGNLPDPGIEPGSPALQANSSWLSHQELTYVAFKKKKKRRQNLLWQLCYIFGLPWWLRGKEFAFSEGDPGLIPGSGRSSGERNGNPLKYAYVGNPIDRRAWQATVHGVAKDQTRLSD